MALTADHLIVIGPAVGWSPDTSWRSSSSASAQNFVLVALA